MGDLLLPVVVDSAVCTFQRLVFAEVRSALMPSGDKENDRCLFLWTAKPVGGAVNSGYSFLSPLVMTTLCRWQSISFQQSGLHIPLWLLRPLWFGKSAFSPDYFSNIKHSVGYRQA